MLMALTCLLGVEPGGIAILATTLFSALQEVVSASAAGGPRVDSQLAKAHHIRNRDTRRVWEPTAPLGARECFVVKIGSELDAVE